MIHSGALTTAKVLLRSLELAIHRLTWVDIAYTLQVNKLVATGHPSAEGKRHVEVRVANPDSPLNKDSMEFDPEEAVGISMRGYDAAVALERSERQDD